MKRPRIRFRLRTLLVLMAICSGYFAIAAHERHRQALEQQAEADVRAEGGWVVRGKHPHAWFWRLWGDASTRTVTEVGLDGTLETSAVADALANFGNLRVLHWPRVVYSEQLDRAIENSPHLERLAISQSLLGRETTDKIARLPRLTLLDLTMTNVTDQLLQPLAGHPSLRVLILGSTDVSNAALEPFREGRLQGLVLSNCRISESAIESIETLRHLAWLDVSDTDVTGQFVARLAGLSKLEYLNLSGTLVTDAALSQLASLQNLNTLHLSRTQVTDAGLTLLAGHPKLKVVSVQFTHISDAGVRALLDMPNTDEIFAEFTDITHASVNAGIQRSTPVQVHRYK
jgi:hypothetical protein